MSNIKTFEFTPSNIGEYIFNIPIYQRLYAWEEAEIKQLLEDLYRQFQKDRISTYYLGNLVLYKNENGRYDVIDGQQRLTTLFLVGLVFRSKNWLNFLKKENDLRLAFVAREDDNAFLKAKIANEEAKASEHLNTMMTNALRIIGEFQYGKDADFQNYVYEKTTMVGIIIPEGIDLNKYFEDMNNRGVQLEKHEILKAKLLSKIKKDNQPFYARLWDACSQMNQYVEYGFDKTLQETRRILFENQNLNQLVSEGNSNINSLQSILALNFEDTHQKNVDKEKKEKEDAEKSPSKVGSIINFPTFILHCYKIWKNDNNVKLSDKDLLDVFSESTIVNIDAQGFIDFLFTCKVLYDAFFIKSIESNDGKTTWEVYNISKTAKKDKPNEFEYERDDDKLKETAVIQAMLNASTSLDNWFTPALKYVKEHEKTLKDEDFCEFLERLDTELAKERMREHKLKEVTDEFLRDFDYKTESKRCYTYAKWLIQNLHNGTRTPRYWFFRLDYYLRKKMLEDSPNDWKVKNYQFRQNRSVEHIYPQSPESGEKWADNNLHNFGNLALISVSTNSKASNQVFKDKKADFEKRTNKWGIESLKQEVIFKNTEWTAEKAQEHSKKMISRLIESMGK